LAEVCLGCFALLLPRLQLAADPKCLGPKYVGVRTIWLQDLFYRCKRVANGTRQCLGLRQEQGVGVVVNPYRGQARYCLAN
jgi:hypothetical protein